MQQMRQFTCFLFFIFSEGGGGGEGGEEVSPGVVHLVDNLVVNPAGSNGSRFLLANVAYRAGEAFTWDAKKLEVPGVPEAAALLERPYRKGWSL